MPFTTAQIAAIKADIAANSDMNTQPMSNAGHAEIARLYNLVAAPTTSVWRTEVPVSLIDDQITYASYTPVDAMPAINSLSGNGEILQHNGRLLAIQTKQMNLQKLLFGRETVDASKANIRAGLRDAVIGLPAGAGGATVSAGGASGVNVLTAMTRPALRIEKLFVGGTATTGTVTANLLVYEGGITADEVATARES